MSYRVMLGAALVLSSCTNGAVVPERVEWLGTDARVYYFEDGSARIEPLDGAPISVCLEPERGCTP